MTNPFADDQRDSSGDGEGERSNATDDVDDQYNRVGEKSCPFYEVVVQAAGCPGGEPAEGDGGGREKQGKCESCEIEGAT